MEEIKQVRWASDFPGIGFEVLATQDQRIFQSDWIKHKGTPIAPMSGTKSKQFFCCIIDDRLRSDEPNCYGITVYKGMAVNATRNCEEALGKVQEAANYYEQHSTWPTQSDDQQ